MTGVHKAVQENRKKNAITIAMVGGLSLFFLLLLLIAFFYFARKNMLGILWMQFHDHDI